MTRGKDSRATANHREARRSRGRFCSGPALNPRNHPTAAATTKTNLDEEKGTRIAFLFLMKSERGRLGNSL